MALAKTLPVSKFDHKRLNRLDKYVMRVERRYVNGCVRESILPGTHVPFETKGPYDQMHYPTPFRDLLGYIAKVVDGVPAVGAASPDEAAITKIRVPQNCDLAVLGFGLGLSGASFASVVDMHGNPMFRRVIGFEIDPRVALDGRMAMKQFKFHNVQVREGDFTKEDLTPFGAFYLYYPVMGIQCPSIMGPTLARTRPGSIFFVADNPFVRDLFINDAFRAAHDMPVRSGKSEFWTFIKT